MDFLTIVQEKLNYSFKNKNLLYQAFIRASYREEHKEELERNGLSDNEILEFLGDAVLSHIVSYELVAKNSQTENGLLCSKDEGELSSLKAALVKKENLANAITRLGFENYLILGEGDKKKEIQNEDSVKEDLFEAIVGAIAIDAKNDYSVLQSVICSLLDIEIEQTDEDEKYVQLLNAYLAKNKLLQPLFRFVPLGENQYRCMVTFDMISQGMIHYHISEGRGKNKAKAKQDACKNAYAAIQKTLPKVAFPEYNQDNSISVLQEMLQKKQVSGLTYDFAPEGEEWIFTCVVDGAEKVTAKAQTKKEAKKGAAFLMLEQLKNKM